MQNNNPAPAKQVAHLENIHIPLWLFKDTLWMLKWITAGTLLIIPTVSVAIIIAWRTRHHRSRFWVNMAVAFWISANSMWMLGEFYEFNFLPWSLSLFLCGIVCATLFFVLILRNKKSDKGVS